MTRLLALETSGRGGSIALLDDGQPVDNAPVLWLPSGQRTAQSLAPAMRELLQQAGWPALSVDLVAVATGPGSFTGLRIGVTTAKAFAYAVRADVLGVSTMDTLAAPISAEGRLWTIIDAQRGDLFVSLFTKPVVNDGPTAVPVQVMKYDQWLEQLQAGDTVTGPVLERIADRLPSGVEQVRASLQTPSAEWVARVAWQLYQSGKRDDVFQLVPQYYRPSAAEEKLSGSRGESA